MVRSREAEDSYALFESRGCAGGFGPTRHQGACGEGDEVSMATALCARVPGLEVGVLDGTVA